ncbi:hypothetical protein GCM10007989_30060 [Devosia pacifica]|uniref:TadE-like domain-containing protein n=1 Tax=Devosia pacifica TaxID=1335967 RepID=A0A918SC09_9HYPH|nr:TadE/TadG family type IV pilus assembly protein [Devosia pacifica]GHA31981.1 hypothetical protein GCM10007989_30060 [Devosia pacifica]
MRAITCLRRALIRFRSDSHAAAAVEFALVLPIMLLLYVGTIEATSLISTDRRVHTISGAIGDLVARKDGSIEASQLNDYFRAAEKILPQADTTGLTQTVTMIHIKSNGDTEVKWSRKFVSGASGSTPGRVAYSRYPLPAEIVNLARDGYVVAAEVSFPHTPILGIVFDQVYNLYSENFFIPRFDEEVRYVP